MQKKVSLLLILCSVVIVTNPIIYTLMGHGAGGG